MTPVASEGTTVSTFQGDRFIGGRCVGVGRTMAGDLRVREYRESDTEAVLTVHEAAFRDSEMTFVAGSAIDEELRDVSAAYLDDGGTFLVGTVEEAVVATGGFRPESHDVAEVGHVRVHPDHQRSGYAGRVMDEIEALARADGFDRLVLETHEDLVAAQALYESRGYAIARCEAHPVTGDEMLHYRKKL